MEPKDKELELDPDILAELLIEKLEKQNLGQYVNGCLITEYRIRKDYIERYSVDMNKNVSLWTQLCKIDSGSFWNMICEMHVGGWSQSNMKAIYR